MNFIRWFVLMLGVSFSLAASNASPRVLICVDPHASFKAEDLASRINAAYIDVQQLNPYKALLPDCLDKPVAVITFEDKSDLIKTIRRLAHRCGYRYLNLVDENLDQATEKALLAIETSPTTSSQIYKLSSEDAIKVYDLQRSIDNVFVKAQLPYWAGRGSLLGAVRHQGNLPWEDYLVLHILDRDETQLKTLHSLFESEGLTLHYNAERQFYKIFKTEGDVVVDLSNPGHILPFRYPVADLYVMTLKCRHEADDLYVHKSWFHNFFWDTENFTADQIAGVKRVPYGPNFMPIPALPELTLNQIYGVPQNPELWRTHGLEPFWDHRIESDHVWPGNSFVVIDDFSPAPWK